MVKQSTSEGVAPAAAAAPATTYSTSPVAIASPPRSLGIQKIIRPFQLVLGIVVLGLSAYIASASTGCYDNGYITYCIRSPGVINFEVWNGVWTLLVGIYLVVAVFNARAYNPIATIVIDALSVVFWFSGFVSLAVFTGAFADYYGDNSSVAFGLLVAIVIFAAVEWILYVVCLVFDALALKNSAHSHTAATPMQQYPNQGVSQGVAQHA